FEVVLAGGDVALRLSQMPHQHFPVHGGPPRQTRSQYRNAPSGRPVRFRDVFRQETRLSARQQSRLKTPAGPKNESSATPELARAIRFLKEPPSRAQCNWRVIFSIVPVHFFRCVGNRTLGHALYVQHSRNDRPPSSPLTIDHANAPQERSG